MVDLDRTEEEAQKKSPEDIVVDPYWDTMTSNPEYRRAYNDAERDGLQGPYEVGTVDQETDRRWLVWRGGDMEDVTP